MVLFDNLELVCIAGHCLNVNFNLHFYATYVTLSEQVIEMELSVVQGR